MPFKHVALNDGSKILQIGFGTWKIPKMTCADQVEQAFEVGFEHIDTAQAYQNEEETGQAIKDTGLARHEIWVTTKWSGRENKGPRESCEDSLAKLGLDYIDLYLIHGPQLCNGDIPGAWREMEELKKMGMVKTIGVSNFSKENLQELLSTSTVKPVVNQILLHPYVIKSTAPLLEYMDEQHIIAEGYSTLIPLTSKPGGPVDKPVDRIAKRLKVKPEQVLLAWSKAKHAIIVTTSSKKERLEDYLAVGDIDLTDDDIAAIDRAGAQGELWEERLAKVSRVAKWVVVGGLLGYLGYKKLF